MIEAGVADDTGARRIEVLRPAVRVREGREAPAERAFELALAAPDLLALLGGLEPRERRVGHGVGPDIHEVAVAEAA